VHDWHSDRLTSRMGPSVPRPAQAVTCNCRGCPTGPTGPRWSPSSIQVSLSPFLPFFLLQFGWNMSVTSLTLHFVYLSFCRQYVDQVALFSDWKRERKSFFFAVARPMNCETWCTLTNELDVSLFCYFLLRRRSIHFQNVVPKEKKHLCVNEKSECLSICVCVHDNSWNFFKVNFNLTWMTVNL
jgi:hypothetical protein